MESLDYYISFDTNIYQVTSNESLIYCNGIPVLIISLITYFYILEISYYKYNLEGYTINN